MILKVLGSDSNGNCYIFETEKEALIIEAGIGITAVKKALEFNVSKVVGCLISHEHGDHCEKAKDYEKVFQLYAGKSTINAKELKTAIEIESDKAFYVGGFNVYPFNANHDVDCLGFVFSHEESGNVMFLTDSYKCEYVFENLHHILIECNYSDKCLEESVRNGLHPSVRDRVRKTHMEISTCKSILSGLNLNKTNNIILLHLSERNSDPQGFYDDIARVTGKPISIAKKGLEIELLKTIY